MTTATVNPAHARPGIRLVWTLAVAMVAAPEMRQWYHNRLWIAAAGSAVCLGPEAAVIVPAMPDIFSAGPYCNCTAVIMRMDGRARSCQGCRGSMAAS